MKKHKAKQIPEENEINNYNFYKKYIYDDEFLKIFSRLFNNNKTDNFDNEKIGLFNQIKDYIKKDVKEDKQLKENVYSVKINANISCLPDKDFINITQSFRIIVENFCDLLKIGTENVHISILSATPGCFNINFGLNINVKEFNLLKLPEVELDLINSAVNFLTEKDIAYYHKNPLQLIKDCVTGYLTRKIPDNNGQLKYIDVKKSKEAKKVIYKTIKKLPKLKSITLENKTIKEPEIDMVV